MTRLQLRNFKLYLLFRDKPMSVAGLLWANRRVYLILTAAFGALVAVMYFTVGGYEAAFMGFVFFVVMMRDIGFFRRSAAVWPALRQVLDWKKIEEMVADAEQKPGDAK